jgi:predicted CopG family antitoxin
LSKYKSVKVSAVHYEELSKLGETKDSFDAVIGRLIETKKKTDGGRAAN